MILFNFFLGFISIFIFPQIYLHFKFKDLKYSLILSYGLIISFSASWFFFLLAYYFKLNHIHVYSIIVVTFITFLIYLYKLAKEDIQYSDQIIIWLITLVLMIPIFQHIGTGFVSLDAVCSWHRWALDFYNNTYNPIDAAYPILLPSLWSLMYKIQGTSDIWWSAQLTLFVIPITTLAIILSLYKETKNKSFIITAILIYPYLLSGWNFNGFMDMPVMITGTLSLTLLYAAEIYKDKFEFEHYIYASLLLAGISSIIKQAGLVFIIFDLVYIAINFTKFKNKKTLFIVFLFSLSYFITFLILYYMFSNYGVVDNIGHLKRLSEKNFSNDIRRSLLNLWNLFFSYPSTIPWISTLTALLKSKAITPYLMAIGLGLFSLKGIRQNSTVSKLSALFFIFGIIMWSIYFSYDARNSYWVKSFFILFCAINFNYILNKYFHFNLKFIMTTMVILLMGVYILLLEDNFAYKTQRDFQIRIGDRKIAKYTESLLQNKDTCTKIYTNDQYLEFNYNTTEAVKAKLVIDRRHGLKALDSIKHHCKDGEYFIFRPITTHYPDWWKIKKLTKDKIIQRISKKDLIYFIPPDINLSKNYFKYRTNIVNLKISNYHTNIEYTIDKFLPNEIYTLVQGWAFIKNAQPHKSTKYIVLKNDKSYYVIETEEMQRPDVVKHFNNRKLINSGFKSYIYKEAIPKGMYTLHLLIVDENQQQYLIKTDKKINID